jgi:hypothetical protein
MIFLQSSLAPALRCIQRGKAAGPGPPKLNEWLETITAKLEQLSYMRMPENPAVSEGNSIADNETCLFNQSQSKHTEGDLNGFKGRKAPK